jgi:RNA polymerase sigma-70 factor (ECF subfamily)
MSSRVDIGDRRAIGGGHDAALMAHVQASDGDALQSLLRQYRRLVYRVAADILRDAGEAEDVTQEVFLEIYRKAHLYDSSRGPVRVWLLQYAYHRSLRRKDALRRRAAYRGEPLQVIDSLPYGQRRGLTRQECRWVIRAGLAQLPARQRATLELACLEELSLRDVAERLRVSLGCVRHYYYRGLARLQVWARQRGIDQASGDAWSSGSRSYRVGSRRAKR